MKKLISVLLLSILVLPSCRATEKNRHDYAYMLEDYYQEKGLNVKVEATGHKGTVLEIEASALIMGVGFYDVNEYPEDYFNFEEMRKLGFTRIKGISRRGRVFFDIEI